MSRLRMDTCFSLSRLVLSAASWCVPSPRRQDWLAEWRSELWYLEHDGVGRKPLRFCLGAFRDALWLRRHAPPVPRLHPHLESPRRCLVFLAASAAVAAVFFVRSPLATFLRDAREHPEGPFAHVLMLAIAVLVLPATTRLTPGIDPAAPASPIRLLRWRRGMFLVLKCLFLLAIVFCGTLDLAPLLGSAGLQPHASLVGYSMALRWAWMDQQRRCPICLRLLAHPTAIGQPAQTFLDWYGTEFCCVRGHGLLYVPEIPTSYSAHRWLDLDSSWSSLFLS